MFDSLTPQFLDEDAAADAQAYELAPQSFFFPFKAEWAIAQGIFSQLALAARDLVITPLTIFKPGVSRETKCYSIMVSVALFLAFGFVAFLKIDMNKMVSWLSTQKYYKLWAYYTIMYITQKYIPKMHSFCHSQIRGSIRAKKGISIFAILVNAVSYTLLYMHQTLYIGTFVAGLGKDKTFFSTVLHNQFIYYKKFVPKATEGNPFIVESLNRIVAMFAFIYIYIMLNGFSHNLVLLVSFEYGCAYIRFFLISLTDDGENFLEKITKLANQAIDYLSGKQSVPTNETVYLTSPHEGIALLFAVLLLQGSIIFKILLVASIVFLAVYSIIFGKDDDKNENEKTNEAKEEEKEDEEEVVPVPAPEAEAEGDVHEAEDHTENQEEGKIEENNEGEAEVDAPDDGGDNDE